MDSTLSTITNHDLVHSQVTTYADSDTRTFHPVDYDEDILRQLAFPYMFERRSTVEPPHRDTCQWIWDTSQFRAWNTQPHGLLWIKGKPGAGKSTLMSYLYESSKLQRSTEGIYLDFFFSARGEKLQREPLGMFRSLLYQVFYQDVGIRHILRTDYEVRRHATGHGPGQEWQWSRQSLEALLMQALIQPARQRRVTIFVDALDEAGEREARNVARYLHHINDKVISASSLVKICISSRHYPIPSAIPGLEIWVESHNTNDIRAFVHDRLGLDYRTSYDTPDLNKWFELRDELVLRAQGIFQWVHLIIPILKQYLYDGDTIQDARERIKELPQELRSVYEYILRDVINHRHRSQSLRLFQWICFAERPLTVDELRSALVAIDTDQTTSCEQLPSFPKTNALMKARIRVLSGGIIEVTTPTVPLLNDVDQDKVIGRMLVQVIHQSVDDFLRQEGFSFLAALQSNTPKAGAISRMLDCHHFANEGHAMIYWSCLKFISSEKGLEGSEDKLNAVPSVPSPGRFLSVSSPPGRFFSEHINNVSSLFLYAIDYLFTHAEKASVSQENDITGQIELLSSVLPQWVMISEYVILSGRSKSLLRKWRLLHLAAMGGLIETLRTLTMQTDIGMDFNDDLGHTALHLAVIHGYADVVRVLVDSGADLNTGTGLPSTPLTFTPAQGHLDVLKNLISIGANLKSRLELDVVVKCGLVHIGLITNSRSMTPLQTAAAQNRVEVLHLLLSRGANPNLSGGSLGSPLYAASTEGAIRCVQKLLEAGADVNASTPAPCEFALQVACREYREEVVKLLLAAGADVNATGGRFGNALNAAVLGSLDRFTFLEGPTTLVQILMQAGANDTDQVLSYDGLDISSYVSEKVRSRG